MKQIFILSALVTAVACSSGETENNNAESSTAENQLPVTDNSRSKKEACNFCTVSPVEFNERIKSQPGQILDVRTPEEVAGGKIGGSVNYDFNGSDFEKQMNQLDKNKTVYVYCAGGGRSAKAMDWMKNNGFKQVVNLDGGMNAWSQNELPVE